MNKEALIGLIVVIMAIAVISAVTGTYGILYIGLLTLFTLVSIKLFMQKTSLSKISAVIINTEILYKFLMPKKYKQAIKELKAKENENN